MYRPFTFAAAFVLTLAATAPIHAQQPGDALPAEITDALDRKDYTTARAALAPLAQDNAVAQYRLGALLLQGQGGPRSSTEGFALLERSAIAGHAPAALIVGRLLLSEGNGVKTRDPERAAMFLTSAADQGNAEAQYYLGLLYKSGTGVAQDDAQSVALLTQAAEGGYREAQYELSRAHASGTGTAVDSTQALRWLRAAADQGHVEAQFYLASALANAENSVFDMDEAIAWYRRAAESGLPIAQRILGNHYLGIQDAATRNPAEALRWLGQAAQAGDPGAMFNLGLAYSGGNLGIPRDDAQAFAWFTKASDEELARATHALAQMHEFGRGVPVDIKKAGLTYRKALEQGDEKAARRLGYLTGQGVLDPYMPPHIGFGWALLVALDGDKDAENWLKGHADAGLRGGQSAYGQVLAADPARGGAAKTYLEQAALAGDVDAQFALGTLLTTGAADVPLDYVEAHKWLNIAATSGSSKAAETRETLNSLMTPDQISIAQDAARVFFETASERLPDGVRSGQTDQ